MFYAPAEKVSNALRLGDVVTGYISVTPRLKEPIINSFIDYKLDVELPKLLVILTPCCSIEEKKISVAPIIQARKSLYENPNFERKLTIINKKMEPEKTFLPEKWTALKDEERALKRQEGLDYTLDYLFIYDENPLLPKYSVRLKGGERFDAGYYEIDFRTASKVECDCILSEKEKNFNEELRNKSLCSKVLELSIDTRQELRDKLAYYYWRTPNEDKIR